MIDRYGKFTYSTINRIENSDWSAITISPNPAKNFITASGLQPNGFIKLYDANGRMLQQQKVNAQSAMIDLGKYNNGIYILQYVSGCKSGK